MSIIILLFNFLALVFLEIILGIDSLIFVAFLATKLKNAKDSKSFIVSGLIVVLLMKILLLLGISYISKITQPLFSISSFAFSISSFVFMIGGGVLIIRSCMDMYDMYSSAHSEQIGGAGKNGYFELLGSLILINFVLALDTVFIGLSFTENVILISMAIVSAIILLSIIADQVAIFLNKYLSIRIAALCFMLFLGFYLMLAGIGFDVSKKYLYAAAIFTVFVELLTIFFTKKVKFLIGKE
jgi:predicted tellurium resistance membrane protein TerC